MGIRIRRAKKARPRTMATVKHVVKYENGEERVKLLTAEGADELRELDDVKSVTKQAERKADKQRQAGEDKAVRPSQTAGAGHQQSGGTK
jgi:hypothetical protein